MCQCVQLYKKKQQILPDGQREDQTQSCWQKPPCNYRRQFAQICTKHSTCAYKAKHCVAVRASFNMHDQFTSNKPAWLSG